MTVNTKTYEKIFVQSRDGLGNPMSGLFIDRKIVDRGIENWFGVSNFCNRGTTTPVHYRVIYSDSEIMHNDELK